MRYVSIPKGGTLSKIAQQEHISLKAILFTNGNLDPRRIQIGQKIAIPETEDDLLSIASTKTKQIKQNIEKQRDVPVGNEPKKCHCKRKNKPWTISQKGIDFIKGYESEYKKNGRHVLYNDDLGYCTIGYGHLVSGRRSCNRIHNIPPAFKRGLTDKEAEELLRKDIRKREKILNKKINVPLCQQEFDALISIYYNVPKSLKNNYTIMHKLNKKDYVGAKLGFLLWNKGRVNGKLVPLRGLTKRRRAEAKIFGEGIYDSSH